MTEGQIQDAVRLVLGADPAGVWWRNNIGTAISTHGKQHIRYGVGNPGGADLIGLYRGRFVAIEIKTPASVGLDGVRRVAGRQTPEQRLWQQLVERKGGIYAIVRSADEAHALLEQLRTL